MNCQEVEIRLCDSLDGTLEGDRNAEFERHLETCEGCAALARDAALAAGFAAKAERVEPPAELVNRLLFYARQAPPGGTLRRWLAALTGPMLEPRFAMSMAMTIVSIAMLATFLAPRRIHVQDLKPAAIWAGMEDRAYRVWGRAVKFYDNLKVVYEIETTLQQWQQAGEERAEAAPESGAAREPADERRLPVHSPAREASPESGPPGAGASGKP